MRGEIVGNAFCYTEIVTGGGAIFLGKILEEYGFEQFNETSSVFVSNKSGVKKFCSGNEGDKSIKKGFDKKLRYGILTSYMSSNQRSALIELFNSKDNINGDYCQLIIGTPASRDGINLYSVLRGYLAMAGWHPSGTHQALARFVRSTSHDMLLNLIKDKMKNEGKDPSFAKVKIEIFKLAGVISESEFHEHREISLGQNLKKDETGSVDIDLYATSEKKDISIQRMMRMLKQCAFDCTIHHSRNIRKDDVDGSAQCDYDICEYKCINNITNIVDEDLIDNTTFDIFYSEDIINECRDDIVKIISKKNSITVLELYDEPELQEYSKKYINSAIDIIIRDRLTIKNRFGFESFINTDGNTLFTQIELPTYTNLKDIVSNVSLSKYKDMLFGFETHSFDEIISSNKIEDDEIILDKIMKLEDLNGVDFTSFSNLFDTITNNKKIQIIEKAVINNIENKDNDFSLAIIKKYNNFIFIKKEPYIDIYKYKEFLESSSSRRGRARKESSCPKLDIPLVGEMPDGESIYIIVNSAGLKIDSNAFRINTQFFNPSDNIRIYKTSEGENEFRNVYHYECQCYKNLISKENVSKLYDFKDKWEQVGTILADNELRIINTDSLNFDSDDKRGLNKGIACKSKEKFSLVEILLKSKFITPEIDNINIQYNSREELEKNLFDKYNVKRTKEQLDIYSDEDLVFIIKWFKNGSKKTICDAVKELFIAEGRIINEEE